MPHPIRHILPIGPLAMLGLIGALSACSRPEPRPEPVRTVRTQIVAAAPSVGAHEFAAEIRARTETRLGFRVGGKLLERKAEVGQRVRAGDELARLDAQDLRLAQDGAHAAAQAAHVNHELAQAEFRRFKELRDQGFIGAAELERREATLKAARAQLEQARAQATAQGNQAAYASLRAPASGVVLAVDAEAGAVLAAGAPVVRMALDGPRDAAFAVPEDLLPLVRPLLGRSGAVQVQLWAGGAPVAGTVREVAAAADPVTRTFAIKAGLADSAAQLGQTAVVRIAAPAAPDVLTLPLTAVREHQGRSAVWVVEPAASAVRLRPIVLGGARGNDVVVSSGLQVGERVVTAGVHVLTEGQVVRVGADAVPAATTAASR